MQTLKLVTGFQMNSPGRINLQSLDLALIVPALVDPYYEKHKELIALCQVRINPTFSNQRYLLPIGGSEGISILHVCRFHPTGWTISEAGTNLTFFSSSGIISRRISYVIV